MRSNAPQAGTASEGVGILGLLFAGVYIRKDVGGCLEGVLDRGRGTFGLIPPSLFIPYER